MGSPERCLLAAPWKPTLTFLGDSQAKARAGRYSGLGRVRGAGVGPGGRRGVAGCGLEKVLISGTDRVASVCPCTTTNPKCTSRGLLRVRDRPGQLQRQVISKPVSCPLAAKTRPPTAQLKHRSHPFRSGLLQHPEVAGRSRTPSPGTPVSLRVPLLLPPPYSPAVPEGEGSQVKRTDPSLPLGTAAGAFLHPPHPSQPPRRELWFSTRDQFFKLRDSGARRNECNCKLGYGISTRGHALPSVSTVTPRTDQQAKRRCPACCPGRGAGTHTWLVFSARAWFADGVSCAAPSRSQPRRILASL